MSTESTEKTPAEILAELERQLEAKTVEVKGADPETAQKIESAKSDLEYLALVQRFNAQGKQGQKYAIVDITSHGLGFVVLVNGPRAELHSKTIAHLATEGKVTDEKVLEITREYVQHPSPEVFDKILSEAPRAGFVCWQALTDLWGERARIRQEK